MSLRGHRVNEYLQYKFYFLFDSLRFFLLFLKKSLKL